MHEIIRRRLTIKHHPVTRRQKDIRRPHQDILPLSCETYGTATMRPYFSESLPIPTEARFLLYANGRDWITCSHM